MAKTFFIILRQLVVPVGESESRLPARAAARLGCEREDIISCLPVRRSLDARKRRGKAVTVYHVRLELPNRLRRDLRKAGDRNIVFEQPSHHHRLDLTDPAPAAGGMRPVVVGAGPAGLFAALRLARAGWKPILLERGEPSARRRTVAADFWRFGKLDPESNVLYGEGGAGLFSDGKLNTRHKDRDGMRNILSILVEAGAPEQILVDAEPHVGSDLLGDVVASVIEEIRRFGGEVRHRSKLVDLHIDGGALRGLAIHGENGGETLEATRLVLASGHSARDVYALLARAGVALAAKPFAVGLRVEMPQEAIDKSQHAAARLPGAASFRLTRAPDEVAGACYTFCMCPGGLVIACASEPGKLAVNGMSFHARAGDWGNAAFLTPVPEAAMAEYGDEQALAGIAFQRFWEEKAFAAGAPEGDYAVPCSGLADFIAGRAGTLPPRRGVARACPANLRELLPPMMGETLSRSIPAMLSRMRHVDLEDVVLYGIETRTSSPVRILRNDAGEASVAGVFPAGEGSGYAGGIMTSALDGWKEAGYLMRSVAGRP